MTPFETDMDVFYRRTLDVAVSFDLTINLTSEGRNVIQIPALVETYSDDLWLNDGPSIQRF
jgi:hypothetical protein